MLLKTHRLKPLQSSDTCRTLLTDLLTTAMDGTGCNWTMAPTAAPTSRPIRQQRTGLEGPGSCYGSEG